MGVEHRHDQADIRFAFLCRFAQMPPVKDRKPDADHQKPGGEGNEMRGVEHVEHAAGGGEHWKRANAARMLGAAAGKEILEGKAEKQAQAEEKPHAGQ